MTGADEVRAQALEVARGWSLPGAPRSWRLTAALFEAIAADDELVGMLGMLPADRLPALLGSAAVAFLVRRDRPSPLAEYFPEPGAAQPPFDEAFFPAFHTFCGTRLDEIAALCRGRRYQMSEVARCAQIAAGIAATAAESGGPMALVDLGTGAGLALRLDCYRYLIGDATFGPAAAGLTLACEVRGPLAPPPIVLPPIAARIGVDLNPIDLADPADRAWLVACAPPEASALSRLSAAVEVAQQHPASIIGADMIDELPRVLADIPPQHAIIVTDAYTAVFLPDNRRAELADILAQAGRRRPVTWLSLDPLVPLGPAGRDSVQGLPLPPALVSDYQQDGVFAVLGARTFDETGDHGRLLARAHPSGQWLEWLERASPAAADLISYHLIRAQDFLSLNSSTSASGQLGRIPSLVIVGSACPPVEVAVDLSHARGCGRKARRMFRLRWRPPAFAATEARPAGRSRTCRAGRWIVAGSFVAVSVLGCGAASTTSVTPAPRTATAVTAGAPVRAAAPATATVPVASAAPVEAAAPAAGTAVPGAPNCPMFPADNVWNTNISQLPVNTHSAAWLASMNSATTFLHPDFGPNPGGYPYGIPFTVVSGEQPFVNVTFQYASESDQGPYPFGPSTPIEGGANSGGDQHAIMVDPRTCTLYELWDAQYSANGSTAGSGAIWQLRSNQLRPAGWTSADAAGLPILPGLLDFAQVQAAVQAGKPITHAIRFTAQVTQTAYVWPARHSAGSDSSPNVPPMGARFRLKASFDVAQFCGDSQSYCLDAKAILTEMQNYGLILADNGTNWYFQGSATPQWPDALVSLLKQIPAAAFQAVDESCLMVAPDSGEARAKPGCPIG